jgi:hypothetical protein
MLSQTLLRHKDKPLAALGHVFATLALLVGLGPGCSNHEPRLVPLSTVQPLMTYQNSSPRFSLKIFMYAPGNLVFRIENLLPDFQLRQLPTITTPSGRVVQATLVDANVVEFNLLLPDDAYTTTADDAIIPWMLDEKGPQAFLRSDGEILVDIAVAPRSKYFVRSVNYRPAADSPPSSTSP